MTVKGLLDIFERYYGEKYSGIFLDLMVEYLENKSEEFLSATASVIIKRFSRIYNKVPDVAVIEKNIDEIIYSMPEPELIEEPKREWTPESLKDSQEGMELLKRELTRLAREKGETPMSKVISSTLEGLI